jgi:hypothetical protein
MARLDFIVIAQHQRPLDGVLQFADITGRAMILKHCHRRVRYPQCLTVAVPSGHSQKMVHEFRDIFSMVAQRWHLDTKGLIR